MNKATIIVIIISLVILVILSAFFSGSEIVYAKVNKIKLEKACNDHKKGTKLALSMVNSYTELLSTILIGNNLVNIASSSLATLLFMYLWPKYGATIQVFVMTIIILIFGEILPKTILATYNYTLSIIFAPILKFISIIFKPIVFIVTFIVNKLSKLWTPKEKEPTATDEELSNMVDEIEDEGYIDEDTADLIQDAIDFIDVDAYEIMQHRVDVFAYNIDDDINELLNDENIYDYSRVPVYKESIDNIIGILNTRDLLLKKLKNEKININKMLTEPVYAFKTESVSQLLKEFKETKTHIAIVKDEYGGTMGIVTLEDVLEELVGEIWDETDEIEEEYHEQRNGDLIVTGDMNVYDMFELLDYDTEDLDTEYSTVGGFCTEKLEKFPEKNDSFIFENFKFTILKADEFTVEKVKIEVLDKEEEND